MKKYLIILLLPLLVFTISCEDDISSITNEDVIEGSYFLHSTSITIIYYGTDLAELYDSTSLVLKTVPWLPPTAEEEFEGDYSNTLKAEIYYAWNSFGTDFVYDGTGVWALNADSIKMGIDAGIYNDGSLQEYEWSLVQRTWTYNNDTLTLTDNNGNYEIWKKD